LTGQDKFQVFLGHRNCGKSQRGSGLL
jgi:hypothetical protein